MKTARVCGNVTRAGFFFHTNIQQVIDSALGSSHSKTSSVIKKKQKTFHSQSFWFPVAALPRPDGEQNESQHKAGICVEENKVAEFSGAVPWREDNILFRQLRALRESGVRSESS